MRQPGFSTADHDDELVLMDTINGGTSLGCDDTWDFGVSNTIPVKMMINHAAKQSEQTEFQRQWRPRGGTGGSDEELDLDDLLQNFMESDSFRADNLQESLDDVDNILKTGE